MMIFALSLKASKEVVDGTQVETVAAATKQARSESEAVGIGIALARKRFPLKDGYHSHGANACKIPEKWLAGEKT